MKFGNSGCKLREEIIMEPIKRTIQKDSLDFLQNLEFSNSKGQSVPSSIIGLSDQIQNITPPLASKHHQLVEFEPADAKIIQSRRESQLTNFKFLYEFWPSANQIFCSGRVISGPKCDRVHNLFTWTIITGVSVCFFVIAAPYIWQEIHWLYVMLITYLYISTNIFLIFTQFSDPGIIPRKEILELQERFEELINKETKEDTSSCSDKRKKYQVQEKKICTTCQIVRPLRCSHCKDCGNCVEVFDHHCPFVNNCIGKRNYRYFIGFLMSVLLLGLGEIGGFMMLFFSNFGDGISQGRESIMIQNQTILVVVLFILGIPTIILTLLVLILALFHILLVYQGKTTKEKLAKQNILSKQKQPSTLWCNGSESMFDLRQKIPLSKIQEHRGKQL